MKADRDPFAGVTVFELGRPKFDAGRYPKDDFNLRAGRDFIPPTVNDMPPDVVGSGTLTGYHDRTITVYDEDCVPEDITILEKD